MSLAFVFPGQGSQRVGMLDDFSGHPQVRQTLREVSDAVGTDLVAMSAAGGDEAALNDTANTQPALLGMSVGIFRAWLAESGARPVAMAGHSLGEYSALVCAQSIDLDEAARLVAARATAMKAAVPKERRFGMSAIVGIPATDVADVCGRHEDVYPVNLNAPTQTVIAGPLDSIGAMTSDLKAAGAKRVVPLAVGVPSHCPWMAPAADVFAQSLAATKIRPPEIPVLQNATVAPAGSPDEIRQALRDQLVQPVDWVGTVMGLYKFSEVFIECGPGQVLTGLNRRIAKGATAAALSDSEHLRGAAWE